MYFKIYTGFRTADDVLARFIYPTVRKLESEGAARDWFFIRYADPEPHIRLRLHISGKECIGTVISRLYGRLNGLVQQGVIHKIQMDTYVRELERYGRERIAGTERMFGIDSRCITDILRVSSDEYMRGIAAFKLIDSIYYAFGFDIERKKDMAGICAEGFRREFGLDGQNAKIFNREYRKYQNVIREVLEDRVTDDGQRRMNRIIERYYNNDITVRLIDGMFSAGEGEVSKDDFIRSYMHMSLNRLFSSDNRKHEMVVHEYMYRYYKSVIARDSAGLSI